MAGFVLKITGFILNLTGFVLNMTRFIQRNDWIFLKSSLPPFALWVACYTRSQQTETQRTPRTQCTTPPGCPASARRPRAGQPSCPRGSSGESSWATTGSPLPPGTRRGTAGGSAASAWPGLWQYGLWSFQTGGTKLEIFLPKNQHT